MKELFTALSIAQSQLEHAKKDSINPHFKSKYADLASCLDAIKEPFAKNGLCITQVVYTENDKYFLKTILAHKSGEFIESNMQIMLTKNDIQGLGSGITYTRRYALQAIAGLGADDDDGNEASRQTLHSNLDKSQTNTDTRSPAQIALNMPKIDENEIYNGSLEHKMEVMKYVRKLNLSGVFNKNKDYFSKMLAEIRPKIGDLEETIKKISETAG